jgi:uncharacterized protein
MESKGDCTFLGENGCTLSEDVRPLMCRLYPYNYNEYGMIGLVLNDDLWCPIHALQPGETLPGMLYLDHDQAEQWRSQYYAELRADYYERENDRLKVT